MSFWYGAGAGAEARGTGLELTSADSVGCAKSETSATAALTIARQTTPETGKARFVVACLTRNQILHNGGMVHREQGFVGDGLWIVVGDALWIESCGLKSASALRPPRVQRVILKRFTGNADRGLVEHPPEFVTKNHPVLS
jgi:hypothetical protein